MRREGGFSLVEVMISIVLLTMVCVASYRSYLTATRMAFVEGLRASALYACQEAIERMLSAPYEAITAENFPSAGGLLLDTRGTINTEDDVLYDRTIQIVERSWEPERQQKDIRVVVTFSFAGETYQEWLASRAVKAGR